MQPASYTARQLRKARVVLLRKKNVVDKEDYVHLSDTQHTLIFETVKGSGGIWNNLCQVFSKFDQMHLGKNVHQWLITTYKNNINIIINRVTVDLLWW